MKLTQNVLRGLARHLGIKVKFVRHLQEDVYGKLLPRERRILINANKPRCEHVYTLLHEVAHYLLHFKKAGTRRHCPWYLKLNWKIDAIADIASKVRRFIRFVFNSKGGKEWEADVWAMCGLIYLKQYGGHSNLKAFLDLHPEKKWIYRLAATATVYSKAKERIATTFKLLAMARRGLSG